MKKTAAGHLTALEREESGPSRIRYIRFFFAIVFLSVLISVVLYYLLDLFVFTMPLGPGLFISAIIPLFVAPLPAFLVLRFRYASELLARDLIVQRNRAELAVEAKNSFLANMSHELRTPLTHIIGFCELLLYEKQSLQADKQEEYLHNILTSSEHLLSIVNDVLDLAKIDAESILIKKQPVDLGSLLNDTLKVFKGNAAEQGVTLKVTVKESAGVLYADEVRIKQIVYNLLSNAVKFTPQGGDVSLLVYSDSGEKGAPVVHMEFRDSGIGIRSEDLKRIFTIFEQVEDSRTRSFQGTGIGLSLVRKLVELHGGEIYAESGGIGKGAVFHVILPLEPFSPEAENV